MASSHEQNAVFQRVSNWSKLTRIIALCFKFIRELKNRIRKPRTRSRLKVRPCNSMSVANLQEAEQVVIKTVQGESFTQELKNLKEKNCVPSGSPLRKLDCFIDEQGLLRVGGRLTNSDLSFNERHPVILPKSSHVSRLVIAYFHEKIAHQGKGMTINEIRANGYWIINMNSLVGQHISKCVTCRKIRSSPQVQKMADLPADRVQETEPFVYSAVDLFGPFFIVDRCKVLKRYGVLFTCMASRAVHLEVVNALTTDSFINSLRRFMSIRGPLRILRCDCGTNFVGAKRELKESIESIDDQVVREFLQRHQCDFEFKFNVPTASHMAGVWERMIRSTRSVLNVLLEQHGSQLDDESLRTLLCEVMSILNSRPLTTDNLNDPSSLEPLTPNHILMMKSNVVLPPPGEFQRADLYSRKRWRRVQYLVNQFWLRWRKEYLQSLQTRNKWSKTKEV